MNVAQIKGAQQTVGHDEFKAATASGMTRCLRPIPYLKRKHPNGFRLENVLQYAAITCLILLPASAARSSRAVNPSDGSTVEKLLRENHLLEVVPLCWATA